MYNVLPTLGNMLGIYDKYALGQDVFSTEDYFVPFHNGSWVTNKMYYDSQTGKAIMLDTDATIDENYIKEHSDKADKIISVSNDIIVHDLVKKTKEQEDIRKGAKK